MASGSDLSTYNEKRDFAKTREPKGEIGTLPWGQGNGFMVQKHDARRLHFDFRLELDGVLKSWAVPNGPSLDPEDKRLAVRTEDHPLSYATFEGTIPAGEYGGGTVMLWDRGTWAPLPGKDPRVGLREGHLHFTLDGERMKGEWIMVRLKPRKGDRGEHWLLRKVEDDAAGGSDDLTGRFLKSMKTGRTMDQIAHGREKAALKSWTTGLHAPASPKPPKVGTRARLPAFREPQKATLVDDVPTGSDWLFEMKYDGYRCLIAVAGGKARIHTRSGLDWTDKFPEIAEAAAALPVRSALLDGEIVSLDEHGRTSFSALQAAISEGGRGLTCFLFDLLALDGRDLTGRTTLERKAALRPLIGPQSAPFLHFADHVVAKGERLLDAMCKAGQEGIIAKRAAAPYRSGRTRNWLKVKCTNRQEFVIVGWIPSHSATRSLRSLLLAVRDGDALRYAGKVGTGFSVDTERDLLGKLKTRTRKTAPADVPKTEALHARWVRPDLVAEVAFAEFTSENVVRHASFLGLRDDKPAGEVVKESAAMQPDTRADHGVVVSHPERILYPESDVTKGDLFAYYETVAPLMLPWIAERPVSLVRCPGGRAKKCFFQKHDGGSFGDAVRHIPIREKDGSTEDYLYIDDVAGLLTCVQMGSIEFHGWGSRIDPLEKPDRMVFDLDPDEGLDFDAVKAAAFDIRRMLADMGLATFPMLTGGKGVHVIVPLTPESAWPAVKDFAHRFALALEQAEPDRFTANMAKAKRKGRIFIDYLRNQRGSTAIMPYSARAREGAPVALPLSWEQLRKAGDAHPFSVRDGRALIGRAEKIGDWGRAAQVLPDL